MERGRREGSGVEEGGGEGRKGRGRGREEEGGQGRGGEIF